MTERHKISEGEWFPVYKIANPKWEQGLECVFKDGFKQRHDRIMREFRELQKEIEQALEAKDD